MRAHKTNNYQTIRKYILTCMILVPFIPVAVILAIGFFYFTSGIDQHQFGHYAPYSG